MSSDQDPSSRWPVYEDSISPTRQSLDQKFLKALDAFVRFFGRHWLALVNLLLLLYIVVPMLAPLLMLAGLPGPAQVVYGLYYPLCHQLPYRSFFIGGQQPVYTYTELWPLMDQSFPPESHRWFLGNAELGYKIALCQRDLAIYGTMLLAGLGFALIRKRYRPLDWRLMLLIFGALTVPIAVDGVSQLFGLRESVWQLRLLTGALFGLGCVWLLYPYIEDGARQAREARAGWGQPPPPS
ncbi:MAG: DUF2085 domain-containing protein [Chloroflexi bacterium]|nr:DUF2085 domain-containing protein [Chloroflexota bacterium]MBU1751115.1 DUF2085 domain-containing protein [Chloroflexota bacterium]MBU1879459.1 DUF2085 domain-containing protein [Chloroflexota bacterium]